MLLYSSFYRRVYILYLFFLGYKAWEMKENIEDILFDEKFKNGIDHQSINEIDPVKRDHSNKSLAVLIGYVLKFKLKQSASAIDFNEVRENSLKLYRQNQFTSFSRKIYLRLAAASILILFAVSGYWLGQKQILSGFDQQSRVIEFNTPKGQQSELTLPDGTFVALNYDSKIKYHISENEHLQEVELDGEAFFKVTKNKGRTFRVITSEMDVNVLGTEFNVKAYPDLRKVETTLLEGSIEIKNIKGKDKTVLLKPGEKWVLNKADNIENVEKVNAKLSSLWRNGEYYFERVSLGDLAKMLNRMYKVNIHFHDSSLENELYSGSVYQDDNIDKIFEFINLTVPVEIKKEKNEILISRK